MGAIWPLDLPQYPNVNGFGRKYPNNLLRSAMDTGPDKVRRRGNAKSHKVTLSYVMYSAEVEIFYDFIRLVLGEGAVCFDWPHPQLQRYVRARMVGQSEGLFDDAPYKDTLCHEISFTLEYWPDAPLA